MTASATLRHRLGRRISSALWGLLVIGAGGLMVASFSGYEIDLQLAAIIVLAALGAWLLLSAAVLGLGRQKEIAIATAPVIEEPLEPQQNEDATAADDPVADHVGSSTETADTGGSTEPSEAQDSTAKAPDDNGRP